MTRNAGFSFALTDTNAVQTTCHSERNERSADHMSFRAKRTQCRTHVIPSGANAVQNTCHSERNELSADHMSFRAERTQCRPLVIPSGTNAVQTTCHSERSERSADHMSFRAERTQCRPLVIPSGTNAVWTTCHSERNERSEWSRGIFPPHALSIFTTSLSSTALRTISSIPSFRNSSCLLMTFAEGFVTGCFATHMVQQSS